MRLFTTFIVLFNCTFGLFAQSNCGNPTIVTVCPTAHLLEETTTGAGNDKTAWSCTTSQNGNDKLYQINTPPDALYVLISFENVSAPFYAIWLGDDCNTTNCIESDYIEDNVYRIEYDISGSTGPFYLWIDHDNASDITYDLRIGAVLNSETFSIPDTRGNWELSSCAANPFKPDGPYFEITYNGVLQFEPMTLFPLHVPGELCVKTFLQNFSGEEGLKKMSFDFGQDLILNSVPSDGMSGIYHSGRWQVNSLSTNNVELEFYAHNGLLKGDFTGTPNFCLEYEVCFNITPLSNDPNYTIVDGLYYPDNYGAPIFGNFSNYCCPRPSEMYCSGNLTGGDAGTTGPIGITFTDPPILPIELLNFTAKENDGIVNLEWETAKEINTFKYEILKAKGDEMTFEAIGEVNAAGFSDKILQYSYNDFSNNSISLDNVYYKLKTIDFDGTYKYSKIVKVQYEENSIVLYPNPANDILNITMPKGDKMISVTNTVGKELFSFSSNNLEEKLDISTLTSGIYYVSISTDHKIFNKKFVKN